MKYIIAYILMFIFINHDSFCQSQLQLNPDSIKIMVNGVWSYHSHESDLSEHLSYYEEIPDFAKTKLNKIADIEIQDDLKVTFKNGNHFTISNSKNEIKYDLSIYPERITISRSDYVITLYYEFDNNGNLKLISRPRVGETRIKLIR